MKLFRISQEKNGGYDTCDSAVVAAINEDAARHINPGGLAWASAHYTWCANPEDVSVEYLGEAGPDVEAGVVCASFNAG